IDQKNKRTVPRRRGLTDYGGGTSAGARGRAMIRFWELVRCVGVDEDAQPFPGMVVPFGGSNIVVLDTDGKDLKVGTDHQGIAIEEFDATELRKKLIDKNIELSQVGVDPLYREAMMPTSMFWYTKPRFFRIH